MKNKIYIVLFSLLIFLSACEPYVKENVEVHKGAYNDVSIQGFNGYEMSDFTIEEKNGKVVVTVIWENTRTAEKENFVNTKGE